MTLKSVLQLEDWSPTQQLDQELDPDLFSAILNMTGCPVCGVGNHLPCRTPNNRALKELVEFASRPAPRYVHFGRLATTKSYDQVLLNRSMGRPPFKPGKRPNDVGQANTQNPAYTQGRC